MEVYVCPRCSAVIEDIGDKTKIFNQSGCYRCSTCGHEINNKNISELNADSIHKNNQKHRKWVSRVTLSFEGVWVVLLLIGLLGTLIAKCTNG